jgi:hypothetical protein
MSRVPTGKTYVIKQLCDFTQVPVECVVDMVADFVDFLAYIHACKMRMDALGFTPDPDWAHFKWTDDGMPGSKGHELQVEGWQKQEETGGKNEQDKEQV